MRFSIIVACCLAAAGAVAMIHPTPPQENPDTIGRWCDRPAGEIIISQAANGFIAVSDVATGYRMTQIVDRDGDVFLVRESPHGDGFRILANGDLQLFDRQGPIRTARKAERSCEAW